MAVRLLLSLLQMHLTFWLRYFFYHVVFMLLCVIFILLCHQGIAGVAIFSESINMQWIVGSILLSAGIALISVSQSPKSKK
jgi:hypothetical protein